jgi:hypothetical protein
VKSATEGDRRRAAQDELIIEALAAGLSYADAGASARVTARTVGRRMSEPEFAARVSQRRGERVSEITGALTTMSHDAIDVLRETMADGKPGDQLRAAHLTLTLMSKFRSETEMEQRLASVERQLAEGAPAQAGVAR